jgi:hypothetical protein
MLEDLKMRSREENGLSDSAGALLSPSVALRAKQMQVLDLERNIMQVQMHSFAVCKSRCVSEATYAYHRPKA